MENVVLQYLPLDKFKLGTKIIGKNGGLVKIDGQTAISYSEKHVMWYGNYRKLKNGNQSIFLN